MSAVLKLILFILSAGAMPVLTGLLPVSFLPQKRRKLPWLILSGYLTTFALFEVIGLPVLLFTTYGDFDLLVRLFSAADLAVIVTGVLRCRRSGGLSLPGRRPKEESDAEALLFWLIFAALLAFELYMSYTQASYDGDDAYYVAQSVQTWQTGTMYLYIPYTGWTTSLDGRHALALMPMWIAYVSTICNTHPAIVTHSLLPFFLIPLADICLYCGALRLTRGQPGEKRRRMLPAMMIILAVMQIFGNVSIYTPETFLIMRTWQGKTLLANLILPTALILLLRYAQVLKEQSPSLKTSERVRTGESYYFWIMIVILNLASGFCTSLAPAMLTVLLLGGILLLAVLVRSVRLLPKMLLACVPNVLYLILLLRTMNSSWFSFLQGGRLP